ncbi:MAG: LysR family transcriptional regulator, partial [Hyphomicrobiales bacterium]|nr:LysR family transcriptional regulator [Hyphomicrobiales bacterium]
RDLRVSAAVASSRINDLEKYLGVRLFHRTTRALHPTDQGKVFYTGATRVLDAINEAESSVSDITNNPRGTLFVAAPLGLGKKLIAPTIPGFKASYPELNIRLRLSDRKIDVAAEGLDLAIMVGQLSDSNLRVRHICDLERVLCAAPSYIEQFGKPARGSELVERKHHCLLHRYPGANEFFWMLRVNGAPKRFDALGPLESDDGDVLTDWALAGCGIVNKPRFEVAEHLASGRLVVVAEETPPTPTPLSCVYPHKRLQDPKARLFLDHILASCSDLG